MFRDWRSGVAVSVLVIATFILGIVVGWGATSNGVEIEGWSSWSRSCWELGRMSQVTHGSHPTVIRYEGIVFDCIPRVSPVDLGTNRVRRGSKLYIMADYHKQESERLRRLGEQLYDMMEAPELHGAGAVNRAKAATYIKWAEEAEAKAAKKESEEE